MTTKTAKKESKGKMSLAEFTQKAIVKLRNEKMSRGINTVYSGYNNALVAYYGETFINSLATKVIWGGVEHVLKGVSAVPNILAQEGKIALRPIKGGKGVQIFLPTELATRNQSNGEAILKKLGIAS